MRYTPPLSLISTTQKPEYISQIKQNIYRKTFNNTTQKRNKPAILSEHSEALKRSTSYLQALRLKRIYTTEGDFTEQSKTLTKQLVQRGYNENKIQQQI